ncbi:hypothetical protein [Amycolatopsis pigmentata]
MPERLSANRELPDQSDQAARSPTGTETVAERVEFLAGGFRPHDCSSCGNRVLAKKNSMKHTSIQWITDAVSGCPVFAEQAAAGTHTALLDTCERLSASIAEAARKGEFGVLDE